MKLRTFLLIAGILTMVFGLAFLLFPSLTMSLYGNKLDVSGQFLTRYWGSSFLGLGVMCWFGRYCQVNEKGMHAILLGGIVTTLTGLLVSVFGAFFGVANSAIWTTVALYFLMLIGFGYFYFKK
jgi:preprotein translocase subunit SecY